MLKLNLRPDADWNVQKRKISGVPTLILKPGDRESARVGLLWIHGGGYIVGMKEMVYMSCAADLLRRYGVTVFSPGYRLAWLHPYPAAADDCFAVLRYMDAHREELGFDRIMVGGESAGGGLCGRGLLLRQVRGFADAAGGQAQAQGQQKKRCQAGQENSLHFGHIGSDLTPRCTSRRTPPGRGCCPSCSAPPPGPRSGNARTRPSRG